MAFVNWKHNLKCIKSITDLPFIYIDYCCQERSFGLINFVLMHWKVIGKRQGIHKQISPTIFINENSTSQSVLLHGLLLLFSSSWYTVRFLSEAYRDRSTAETRRAQHKGFDSSCIVRWLFIVWSAAYLPYCYFQVITDMASRHTDAIQCYLLREKMGIKVPALVSFCFKTLLSSSLESFDGLSILKLQSRRFC
jgi:hypothetical protein